MNNPVDLVAVVGSCAPERHMLAQNLAAQAGRWFIPSRRLAIVADPLEELISLARWANPPEQIIAELPDAVTVTDTIGALTASDSPVRLREVLCVVDASHLIPDLMRDEYTPIAPAREEPQEYMARALLTVTQIEFASTVHFVNWESLSTPDLSTMMSVISHLAPEARLQLHGVDTGQPAPRFLDAGYSAQQDRPGWIRLLNEEFAPHMTDSRVSALHYQRVGAFHPERLQRVLDEQIEAGRFGKLLRSSGFCSFATRPGYLARWSHVGSMIDFAPILTDASMDDDQGSEFADAVEEFALSVHGQDLALIGLDLDHEALTLGLDAALLTDAEFTAGPEAWRRMPDPFPEWQLESRERE